MQALLDSCRAALDGLVPPEHLRQVRRTNGGTIILSLDLQPTPAQQPVLANHVRRRCQTIEGVSGVLVHYREPEPLLNAPTLGAANESPAERLERILPAFRERSGTVEPEALYYLMRQVGIGREDSLRVLRTLVERGSLRLPAITQLELFLTEACNLNCSYCFVEGKNAKNIMSVETAKRAADFLIRESHDPCIVIQ